MTKKRSNILTLLPACIFISNELIRTYIRPVYGQKKYGMLGTLLGWLPNYLAALGIVSIAIAVVQLVQPERKKPFSNREHTLIMTGTSFVGLAGLIGHEMTQKGTGLFYDANDIYATLAGIATGNLLYYLLLMKRQGTRRIG